MSAMDRAVAMPRGPSSLSVLIQHRAGAFDRVIALVRRQGWHLVGLALDATSQPGVARVRLTIDDGDPVRLARQLARLVDVIAVHEEPADADAPRTPNANPTPYHFQADGMSARHGDDPSHEPLED
jgi:acetolactate synthase regulatory subunit